MPDPTPCSVFQPSVYQAMYPGLKFDFFVNQYSLFVIPVRNGLSELNLVTILSEIK